ncbi:hypothetical protein LCGC14_0565290 [marine sediment metagenome]|uniref:DUF4158 domain-containing protein n=1 Tax=marine sediment metagenome TaxID=412755 RepID=A0A0F9S4C0_9ZZZZ
MTSTVDLLEAAMEPNMARAWGLSFNDLRFLSGFSKGLWLEVALQLSNVRNHGRFVEDWLEIDNGIISYVSSKLDVPPEGPVSVFSGRSARRYRLAIVSYLNLSRPTVRNRATSRNGCVIPHAPKAGPVMRWCNRALRGFGTVNCCHQSKLRFPAS